MTPDPITRLNAALKGRYRIERELGEGGMATVYLVDTDCLRWRTATTGVTGKRMSWFFAAVWGLSTLTAFPAVAQDQEELISFFLEEFEIPDTVYDSIMTDSLRVLSEVRTADKTVIPVSYLRNSRLRCRAAALLIFLRTMQIVASRDQRGNVEIDVTCNQYRSTIEVRYGEYVRLVERLIGSETVIFSKTVRGVT